MALSSTRFNENAVPRAVACLFADVTLGRQRWGFSSRTCARSSFVNMRTQSSYPNFPRKMDDIRPFNAATKSYVAFERVRRRTATAGKSPHRSFVWEGRRPTLRWLLSRACLVSTGWLSNDPSPLFFWSTSLLR